MDYGTEFELDFMRRTLKVVQNYSGPSDATLLLNCLLGLLIVPKENLIDEVPNDPVEDLGRWGISPSSIKQWGAYQDGNQHPETLRQLVWSLRNSVAHFRIKPRARDRRCIGFDFSDQSGFRASINLKELRHFVELLAKHLESAIDPANCCIDTVLLRTCASTEESSSKGIAGDRPLRPPTPATPCDASAIPEIVLPKRYQPYRPHS